MAKHLKKKKVKINYPYSPNPQVISFLKAAKLFAQNVENKIWNQKIG
jgi:hypothetical protein